jgi:hypothetical protein
VWICCIKYHPRPLTLIRIIHVFTVQDLTLLPTSPRSNPFPLSHQLTLHHSYLIPHLFPSRPLHPTTHPTPTPGGAVKMFCTSVVDHCTRSSLPERIKAVLPQVPTPLKTLDPRSPRIWNLDHTLKLSIASCGVRCIIEPFSWH